MTDLYIMEIGNSVSFRLIGHAGFNPGNDVVCAGISTLTFMLANYLDDALSRGKISKLLVKDDPGDMLIQFEIADYPEWEEVKRLITTGYEMLSENYPANMLIRWDT